MENNSEQINIEAALPSNKSSKLVPVLLFLFGVIIGAGSLLFYNRFTFSSDQITIENLSVDTIQIQNSPLPELIPELYNSVPKLELEEVAPAVSQVVIEFNKSHPVSNSYPSQYENLNSIQLKMRQNLNKQQQAMTFDRNMVDTSFAWRKSEKEPFIVIGPALTLVSNHADNVKTFQSLQDQQLIHEIVDSTLSQYGFELDIYNTSPSMEQAFFTRYQRGYLRDNQYCLLQGPKIHDSSSTNITFVCAENYDQSFSMQNKFLEVLKEPTHVATITKQIGNFTKLNVGDVRFGSGFMTIIVETDSGLEKIFEGQESPSCDLVEKWKIPSEITDKCYQGNDLIENKY